MAILPNESGDLNISLPGNDIESKRQKMREEAIERMTTTRNIVSDNIRKSYYISQQAQQAQSSQGSMSLNPDNSDGAKGHIDYISQAIESTQDVANYALNYEKGTEVIKKNKAANIIKTITDPINNLNPITSYLSKKAYETAETKEQVDLREKIRKAETSVDYQSSVGTIENMGYRMAGGLIGGLAGGILGTAALNPYQGAVIGGALGDVMGDNFSQVVDNLRTNRYGNFNDNITYIDDSQDGNNFVRGLIYGEVAGGLAKGAQMAAPLLSKIPKIGQTLGKLSQSYGDAAMGITDNSIKGWGKTIAADLSTGLVITGGEYGLTGQKITAENAGLMLGQTIVQSLVGKAVHSRLNKSSNETSAKLSEFEKTHGIDFNSTETITQTQKLPDQKVDAPYVKGNGFLRTQPNQYGMKTTRVGETIANDIVQQRLTFGDIIDVSRELRPLDTLAAIVDRHTPNKFDIVDAPEVYNLYQNELNPLKYSVSGKNTPDAVHNKLIESLGQVKMAATNLELNPGNLMKLYKKIGNYVDSGMTSKSKQDLVNFYSKTLGVENLVDFDHFTESLRGVIDTGSNKPSQLVQQKITEVSEMRQTLDLHAATEELKGHKLLNDGLPKSVVDSPVYKSKITPKQNIESLRLASDLIARQAMLKSNRTNSSIDASVDLSNAKAINKLASHLATIQGMRDLPQGTKTMEFFEKALNSDNKEVSSKNIRRYSDLLTEHIRSLQSELSTVKPDSKEHIEIQGKINESLKKLSNSQHIIKSLALGYDPIFVKNDNLNNSFKDADTQSLVEFVSKLSGDSIDIVKVPAEFQEAARRGTITNEDLRSFEVIKPNNLDEYAHSGQIFGIIVKGSLDGHPLVKNIDTGIVKTLSSKFNDFTTAYSNDGYGFTIDRLSPKAIQNQLKKHLDIEVSYHKDGSVRAIDFTDTGIKNLHNNMNKTRKSIEVASDLYDNILTHIWGYGDINGGNSFTGYLRRAQNITQKIREIQTDINANLTKWKKAGYKDSNGDIIISRLSLEEQKTALTALLIKKQMSEFEAQRLLSAQENNVSALDPRDYIHKLESVKIQADYIANANSADIAKIIETGETFLNGKKIELGKNPKLSGNKNNDIALLNNKDHTQRAFEPLTSIVKTITDDLRANRHNSRYSDLFMFDFSKKIVEDYMMKGDDIDTAKIKAGFKDLVGGTGIETLGGITKVKDKSLRNLKGVAGAIEYFSKNAGLETSPFSAYTVGGKTINAISKALTMLPSMDIGTHIINIGESIMDYAQVMRVLSDLDSNQRPKLDRNEIAYLKKWGYKKWFDENISSNELNSPEMASRNKESQLNRGLLGKAGEWIVQSPQLIKNFIGARIRDEILLSSYRAVKDKHSANYKIDDNGFSKPKDALKVGDVIDTVSSIGKISDESLSTIGKPIEVNEIGAMFSEALNDKRLGINEHDSMLMSEIARRADALGMSESAITAQHLLGNGRSDMRSIVKSIFNAADKFYANDNIGSKIAGGALRIGGVVTGQYSNYLANTQNVFRKSYEHTQKRIAYSEKQIGTMVKSKDGKTAKIYTAGDHAGLVAKEYLTHYGVQTLSGLLLGSRATILVGQIHFLGSLLVQGISLMVNAAQELKEGDRNALSDAYVKSQIDRKRFTEFANSLSVLNLFRKDHTNDVSFEKSSKDPMDIMDGIFRGLNNTFLLMSDVNPMDWKATNWKKARSYNLSKIHTITHNVNEAWKELIDAIGTPNSDKKVLKVIDAVGVMVQQIPMLKPLKILMTGVQENITGEKYVSVARLSEILQGKKEVITGHITEGQLSELEENVIQNAIDGFLNIIGYDKVGDDYLQSQLSENTYPSDKLGGSLLKDLENKRAGVE